MPVTEGSEADRHDTLLLQVAAQAFSPFGKPALVGLAVSGGSDSMAMLHLMARAAPQAGWSLRAVTVDHGLRPEAADEARFVAGVCAKLSVPHDVVHWEHGVIAGNLMERAARARYGLIAGWARGHGIGHVTLAHTATDQAETFLMGLSRAAGLDGLSGMRSEFRRDGVQFVRPFLSQTRLDLRSLLSRLGMSWVDDPTNENDRFTRVKARRALTALAPLGITDARLANTVQHLAMAQQVVRHAARDAATLGVTEVAGSVRLDRSVFRGLAMEVQRRVLVMCLMWLTGDDHAPRAAAIQRVLSAIAQGRDATLAGCRLNRRDDGVIIAREPKALGAAVAPGQTWDGRWRVDGPDMPGARIGALGAAGLTLCKHWRRSGLPRQVLVVTPAVWQGQTLIAAPALGLGAQWSASVSQSFDQFILSH